MGRVLAPTGKPVVDCLLLTEVYTTDRQAQLISTRTDLQGEFKLTLTWKRRPLRRVLHVGL